MKLSRSSFKRAVDLLPTQTKKQLYEVLFNKKNAEGDVLDLMIVVANGIGLNVTVPTRLRETSKYVKDNSSKISKNFTACFKKPSKQMTHEGTGVFQIGGALSYPYMAAMITLFSILILLAMSVYIEYQASGKAYRVYSQSELLCHERFSMDVPENVHIHDWSVENTIPNLLSVTRSLISSAYKMARTYGGNAGLQEQLRSCIQLAQMQRDQTVKNVKYNIAIYGGWMAATATAMVTAEKARRAGINKPMSRALTGLLTSTAITYCNLSPAMAQTLTGFIMEPFSSTQSAAPPASSSAAPRSPPSAAPRSPPSGAPRSPSPQRPPRSRSPSPQLPPRSRSGSRGRRSESRGRSPYRRGRHTSQQAQQSD